MGDWVFEQPEKNASTILEGIKEEASGTQINYVDVGWNMRALDSAKIEEAIQTAKSSGFGNRHSWRRLFPATLERENMRRKQRPYGHHSLG